MKFAFKSRSKQKCRAGIYCPYGIVFSTDCPLRFLDRHRVVVSTRTRDETLKFAQMLQKKAERARNSSHAAPHKPCAAKSLVEQGEVGGILTLASSDRNRTTGTI